MVWYLVSLVFKRRYVTRFSVSMVVNGLKVIWWWTSLRLRWWYNMGRTVPCIAYKQSFQNGPIIIGQNQIWFIFFLFNETNHELRNRIQKKKNHDSSTDINELMNDFNKFITRLDSSTDLMDVLFIINKKKWSVPIY